MKLLSRLLLFLIASYLFCSCGAKITDDSYIKFKYTGAQDKLIPQVVFYDHSITNDIIGYGSGFLLTTEEFEKIKNFIQQDSKLPGIRVVNDSVNAGLYNFYIFENSSIRAYHSSDKQILNSIFEKIRSLIIDPAKKDSVQKVFDNILRRL